MNRILRVAFTLLILFIFSPKSFLLSENHSAIRIITYPGETCKTPPLTKWSEQEKWVWKQLCEGKPANLARHYGGSTNPKDFKGWQKKQKLSPEFLETILLYNPFLNELKNKRVRIIGAWFEKPLVLSDINLTNNIFLNNSRFDQSVSLYDLKSNHVLSFDYSAFDKSLDLKAVQLKYLSLMHGKFKGVNLVAAKIEDIGMNDSEFLGDLNMDSIEISKHLHMTGKAKFKKVNLISANIGGVIEMEGSEFLGELKMEWIEVGKSLGMNKSKFNEVNLARSNIGSQIAMNGSEFLGELNMEAIEVGESLLMRDNAKFNKLVILKGAHIGQQIDMSGSEFLDELDMESIEVGENLFMRNNAKYKKVNLANAKIVGQVEMEGSEFLGELIMYSIEVGKSLFLYGNEKFNADVKLIFSKIGSNLDISNSSFVNLKLTGTHINGELRLGSNKSNDIWAEQMDIKGLTYSEIIDMNGKLPLKNLKDFLEKQTPYNPQPYKQLESVLRDNGHIKMANQILFERREKERTEADFPRNLGLLILKLGIGYGIGYRYFYILFWIVPTVLIGCLVLNIYGDNKSHKIKLGIWFSIDMLLPIIRLREEHYTIDLSEPANNYFYFHKILGYVMAFFLIAGLSGITK